jgi:hypothetical protein
MRRSVLRCAVAAVAAGGLVAVGTSSALASPQPVRQVVEVVGNGSHVYLDHNAVQAGSIQFRVSTSTPAGGSGSDISLFKLQPGTTLGKVVSDFNEEFGAAPAKGTRDLTRDITIYGLADVIHGYPMVVTEPLAPGTYYMVDSSAAPPSGPSSFTRFTVGSDRSGVAQSSDRASALTVKTTTSDRFVAPDNWPHDATVTVANVSDTLHFMDLQPVKPGTTDRQVQAYFDSGSQAPPPFAAQGPTGGSDVLSPGRTLQLTYDLPAGTYVLLCFIADDQTGMPHAVMGMHKVVVIH